MSKVVLKALAKNEKVKLVNFKAKDSELRIMEKNAKKYAGGNVSHWIRHSAMNYVPSKKDLSEV